MKRRRGQLSPEDREIWARVAQSAKPLPGRTMPIVPKLPVAKPAMVLAPPPLPEASVRPRPLPPLAGLEKRMRRDVARGIRTLDARIDLHGLRQAEAHQTLLAFLHRQHQQGGKLVLVITGKGGGLDARGAERGVLRRMVPHWLAEPGLRRIILGYEPAAIGHGGDGALYVRLRRDRSHREA